MRKAVTMAFVSMIAVGGLGVAMPSAQAASCSSGLIKKAHIAAPDQHRAFGSCSSYDRSGQQARLTADCIGAADRNTSWFSDNTLHYTGWCAFNARNSFVSVRN